MCQDADKTGMVAKFAVVQSLISLVHCQFLDVLDLEMRKSVGMSARCPVKGLFFVYILLFFKCLNHDIFYVNNKALLYPG